LTAKLAKFAKVSGLRSLGVLGELGGNKPYVPAFAGMSGYKN
jgi:hypothetical protein